MKTIEFESTIGECDGYWCVFLPENVSVSMVEDIPAELRAFDTVYRITIEEVDNSQAGY